MRRDGESELFELHVSARVLVAADDVETRDAVSSYLVMNGLKASMAASGTEFLSMLAVERPQIVLLDRYVGCSDGFDLLREVRSTGRTPVIMLTPQDADEVDRIVAFELGADDCSPRPLNLRYLLAQIRTQVRMRPSLPAGHDRIPGSRYAFGGLVYDEADRMLHFPDGHLVMLNKAQHGLLSALLRSPRDPVASVRLSEALMQSGGTAAKDLKLHILQLRRKFSRLGSDEPLIVYRAGRGFMLDANVERV